MRRFNSVKIKINDTNLERVKECKYLGVLLDETLSWKPQINQVRNKALRNIHLLKRTRNYVDNRTALLLYKTLVQPHFDYCSSTWMNGNLSDLQTLQTLQNRALRIVLGVEARYNRKTLYRSLNMHGSPPPPPRGGGGGGALDSQMGMGVPLGVQNLTLSQTARRTKNTPCHNIPC